MALSDLIFTKRKSILSLFPWAIVVWPQNSLNWRMFEPKLILHLSSCSAWLPRQYFALVYLKCHELTKVCESLVKLVLRNIGKILEEKFQSWMLFFSLLGVTVPKRWYRHQVHGSGIVVVVRQESKRENIQSLSTLKILIQYLLSCGKFNPL